MWVRVKGQPDNAGALRHHFRAGCSRDLLVKRPQGQSFGATDGNENEVVGEVFRCTCENRYRDEGGFSDSR